MKIMNPFLNITLLLILFPLNLCTNFNQINLPPPEEYYKILFLIPMGLTSHRNVMLPIAGALADRGHEVVLLSALPPTNRYPKLQELQHHVNLVTKETRNMFERRYNVDLSLDIFSDLLVQSARKSYNDPVIKKLFEERDKFDLIVIDSYFNEFAYPFVHGKTFILTDPIGINQVTSSILGNVLNPIYSHSAFDFSEGSSIMGRIKSIYQHFNFPYNWRQVRVVPLVQTEISKLFPHLPPLLEIEKNASLVLANTDFSIAPPVPLLPNQILIGGHVCTDVKPLPRDISQWVEEAEHGVIYFSMGGVTPGTAIPDHFRDIMITAFERLPQRIIWKYEGDIPNLPTNILIKDWIPQQDLIGHNNTKLFITHGGLLSVIESVCHGIPLLGLPMLGDQVKNGKIIRQKGFGTFLDWDLLNSDLLVETIRELINNDSYKKRIREASDIMKDRQESPLQRAVWWTEYVSRHKGAIHLRCPGAKFSWREYLMLDLLFFIHIVFVASYVILKWLGMKFYRSFVLRRPTKKLRGKND